MIYVEILVPPSSHGDFPQSPSLPICKDWHVHAMFHSPGIDKVVAVVVYDDDVDVRAVLSGSSPLRSFFRPTLRPSLTSPCSFQAVEDCELFTLQRSRFREMLALSVSASLVQRVAWMQATPELVWHV